MGKVYKKKDLYKELQEWFKMYPQKRVKNLGRLSAEIDKIVYGTKKGK